MTRRKLLKYTGVSALVAIGSGAAFTRPHSANPYYSGPPSDHFDGKVFFNPNGAPPGKLTDLLKWRFGESRAQWPERYDSPHHGEKPPQIVGERDIRVSMVGHASFLIQTNGLNLLTDPVWSERASPIGFAGPKRVNPPGINFEDLPKIDAVLVTHNHYDHLDIDTLGRLVSDHDPQIITPLGNDTIIRNAVPAAKTQTGDWDDTIDLANNTKIHFDPCHHWGARGMRDRRMALWAAFTIETPRTKIHHIGDTGFHSGIFFERAKEKHGAFDLAILPIGAYEPRWFMKGQHMNPQEAVDGFRRLNARHAIGHHWGTFQLTDEPIDEPPQKLAEALKEAGIEPDRFNAFRPGQVFNL